MMGIAINREIIARRNGKDKIGRPTEILTLDDGGEFVLEYNWWERAGEPDVGDRVTLTINVTSRGSEQKVRE